MPPRLLFPETVLDGCVLQLSIVPALYLTFVVPVSVPAAYVFAAEAPLPSGAMLIGDSSKIIQCCISEMLAERTFVDQSGI